MNILSTGLPGPEGQAITQIKSIKTADLNDTTFTDVSINTQSNGYIYKIELWNDAPGNRFLVGDPAYSSSVYLSIAPGDRKAKFTITRNVPWINTQVRFLQA